MTGRYTSPVKTQTPFCSNEKGVHCTPFYKRSIDYWFILQPELPYKSGPGSESE